MQKLFLPPEEDNRTIRAILSEARSAANICFLLALIFELSFLRILFRECNRRNSKRSMLHEASRCLHARLFHCSEGTNPAGIVSVASVLSQSMEFSTALTFVGISTLIWSLFFFFRFFFFLFSFCPTIIREKQRSENVETLRKTI